MILKSQSAKSISHLKSLYKARKCWQFLVPVAHCGDGGGGAGGRSCMVDPKDLEKAVDADFASVDSLDSVDSCEPANSSSVEMRDKAYEICRQYLSGEWKNITSDDMVFKTVSGGLSNLLYYCSLPSTHTPMTGEPSQVLLRMYGQLLDKNDTKITDSVITMLLSERNLGPKLYGIFPGGRLEEYIPSCL